MSAAETGKVANKVGGQSRRYKMLTGETLGPENIGGFSHVSAFICDQGGGSGDLFTSHDGTTWSKFANIATGTAVTHFEVGPIHYLKFECAVGGASCLVVANND